VGRPTVLTLKDLIRSIIASQVMTIIITVGIQTEQLLALGVLNRHNKVTFKKSIKKKKNVTLHSELNNSNTNKVLK